MQGNPHRAPVASEHSAVCSLSKKMKVIPGKTMRKDTWLLPSLPQLYETSHRRCVGRKNRPGREIQAVMCLSTYVLHSPRLGSRVCTSAHPPADVISFFCSLAYPSLQSSVLTLLFSFAVLQTAENKRPLILSPCDLTNPPGTVSHGEQLEFKKDMSDWDLFALKVVSVLCDIPVIQQCRCCPGFSLSIAAPGTKPVTSDGAKCSHTIIQELLCVTEDSGLVLESLKALLTWSFLLYIASALLQFKRSTSILE